MDGAADSPSKGDPRPNKRAWFYELSADRDSFVARNIVPLVRLYFPSLLPPPSSYSTAAIFLFCPFPRPRFRYSRIEIVGGRGKEKKVINRARREITIISAFVPSGVYIDFRRRGGNRIAIMDGRVRRRKPPLAP